MEEKAPLLPDTHEHIKAPPPDETMPSRKTRRTRLQMAAFVLLFSLFWLARTFTCTDMHDEADTMRYAEGEIRRIAHVAFVAFVALGGFLAGCADRLGV